MGHKRNADGRRDSTAAYVKQQLPRKRKRRKGVGATNSSGERFFFYFSSQYHRRQKGVSFFVCTSDVSQCCSSFTSHEREGKTSRGQAVVLPLFSPLCFFIPYSLCAFCSALLLLWPYVARKTATKTESTFFNKTIYKQIVLFFPHLFCTLRRTISDTWKEQLQIRGLQRVFPLLQERFCCVMTPRGAGQE